MNVTERRPRLQGQPLQPANVLGRFVGAVTRQDVLDGQAVLSITDRRTGAEKPYWCLALIDGGRCVGFALTPLGGGEAHVLSRDLSACSCPDRQFKPGRPGGCRHMASMRQALATLGK